MPQRLKKPCAWPGCPELVEPWERQPHESDRAFHAFIHYRDLGPGRSLDKAWQEHVEKCLTAMERRQNSDRKEAPRWWDSWSAKWSWVSRVQAWDAELDRRKREAQVQEVEEMEKRHAQMAKNTLAVLNAIIAILGNRIQGDKLSELDEGKLADLAVKAARSTPEVAKLERTSRGMPGEINEQREFRQVTERHEYEIIQRVITDPEARGFARGLYARVFPGQKDTGQG